MDQNHYSGDWWANSADDVQIRACYFDDRYVFDEDGFQNDQGEETWLEWWQGMDPEGCGAPVFPHDGSNPAIQLDMFLMMQQGL